MAKKVFTDESLATLVGSVTAYIDSSINDILPEISSDDEGKFLRVSSDGTWEVATITNAEEVSF